MSDIKDESSEGKLPQGTQPKEAKFPWYVISRYIIFACIALSFIAFIIFGIAGKNGFLHEFRDPTFARGIITFFVVIITVAIAVILTIASVIGASADIEKRFGLGKEILTILTGILGTILGFYFGQAREEQLIQVKPSVIQTQDLHITPPRISNSQPKRGEKVNLLTTVSGGRKPYTYSIKSNSAEITGIQDESTPDGYIIEDIQIPSTLSEKVTEIVLQIYVKDSDGKTTQYNKDEGIKFIVK